MTQDQRNRAGEARNGDVRVHESKIGVWENGVDESAYRKAVFLPLIRFLRSRGWKIMADPFVMKNYRRVSAFSRVGEKGPLRAELRLGGRHIELNVWSEDFPAEAGRHKYEFNIRDRMPPLTRRRMDLELSKVCAWLAARYGYNIDRSDERLIKDAKDRIQHHYDTCGHFDPVLGHPKVDPYSNKTADGSPMVQGATVWARRRDGRVVRGTLYIRLGAYHAVLCNDTIELVLPSAIMYSPPENLGRCIDAKTRRSRLEAEINHAIERDDFTRAAVLHRVMFGSVPLYRIFSKKTDAYYRPLSNGYSAQAQAGRFTADEAIRICRGADYLRPVPIGSAPALELSP